MMRFVLLWTVAGYALTGCVPGDAGAVVDPLTTHQDVLTWCDAVAQSASDGGQLSAYDSCLADAGLVDTYSKKDGAK